MRWAQGLGDALKHTVGIAERVVIPESRQTVAKTFQERGAPRIVVRTYRMLPAVELHDQPPLTAAEVDNVGADRDLARELHAEQASIPQAGPDAALCIGLPPTQPAREVAR